MGRPIIPDEVGTQRAPAPPQPRGLARPARSFKRLEGSAAAADVLARQGEQPTGGRRHTQGSGWTGAACAGACEERAATSRCRDRPDQRPPLNNQGASDGATPAGAFPLYGEAALRPHQQEA